MYPHFVKSLHDIFESSPSIQLLTYPHASVAGSKADKKRSVNLVLASAPLRAELGLTVESLRVGNMDSLGKYDGGSQS